MFSILTDMIDLTSDEKALIARAINTERNLLARLYGMKAGRRVEGYMEGVTFPNHPQFQQQVDSIFAIEEKLYPGSTYPKKEK